MCEQCITNPLYFGQPIPGYTLMRARREGNDVPLLAWGLIECNDPTFTFSFDFGLVVDSSDWHKAAWAVASDLRHHPVEGFKLVTACIPLGYAIDGDVGFVDWLLQHIRSWLVVTPPTTDDDPFPNLDEHRAHDYSPWIAPVNDSN